MMRAAMALPLRKRTEPEPGPATTPREAKMKAQQRTVDVGERLPLLQSLPLSLQHLFAMFGATVLVPYLVGLDTSVTLFTSGVGTLLYIFVTKGKIPAYLGSSFAFIAAFIGLLGAKAGELAPPDRIAVAMGGCVVVGIIYILVALVIGRFGTGWIERLLPAGGDRLRGHGDRPRPRPDGGRDDGDGGRHGDLPPRVLRAWRSPRSRSRSSPRCS